MRRKVIPPRQIEALGWKRVQVKASHWPEFFHKDGWHLRHCGHDIDLTQGPNHELIGHGVVLNVWTGPFNEVSAKVLDRNHSGSQSYTSVLLAMRNAYGYQFREDEVVVFLDYKRIN
jgi:hypothetical protein